MEEDTSYNLAVSFYLAKFVYQKIAMALPTCGQEKPAKKNNLMNNKTTKKEKRNIQR